MSTDWTMKRRRSAGVGITVGGAIGFGLAYQHGGTLPALLFIPVFAVVGFVWGSFAGSYWENQPDKKRALIWTIAITVIAFVLYFAISRWWQT
jgi:hypothetical protein